MTKHTAHRKFEVYIRDRRVNIVFWSDGVSAREVRRALIDHDGMPASISVYRLHQQRYAYDDCARVSHPEEC